MPRKGWVSVPEVMVEKVKRVIRERPDLGYKSTSGYVADAVRRLLKEYNLTND